MKLVKLRFSLMTLLMIPAAFAAGWWLGARTEKHRITILEKEHARKLTESEQVLPALNAAIFINRIYYEADAKSPQEQQSRRDSLLVLEVLYLARAEEFGHEKKPDAFLKLASGAIDLLRVSSYEEFIVKVKGMDKFYSGPFSNPQDEDYAKATDFLRRVFAERESEPWYPARVWIKAIFDDDADLLRTAYSEKIQKSVVPWEE